MLLLAALATGLPACAYFNTFFLAKKYYFRATAGHPYEVDRVGSAQSANYGKSIEYAKKVIGVYPKSNYVDDAWLLWSRALIGRDDPLQTVEMLQDFPSRFPRSELKPEAEFYLALAYRNGRKYAQSVDAFEDFLGTAPKSPLVPYAYLERAGALASMKRYAEAAQSAGVLLDRFPRNELVDKARRQRAEALFQEGQYDSARADFHAIGLDAKGEEERLQFFMREVDCQESARAYDAELATLREELSHTPPPAPLAAGQVRPLGEELYGRLTLRIGGAHLLAGNTQGALEEFQHVLQDYPKSALAAEAQFKIGYANEVGAGDFERAIQEYAKVKDVFGQSRFTTDAQQRSDDLGRIMQFRRGTGADSLEKQAEAAFLTAELYLFQLDKPARALEQYAHVVDQYPHTEAAGRALMAQGWVLSRKLNRRAAGDSLFWRVVREYKATEAQLASRDYLELDGEHVPDSLIVAPKVRPAPTVADTMKTLTPPPATPPLGGLPGSTLRDSLRVPPGARLFDDPRHLGFVRDSTGRFVPAGPGLRDSLGPPRLPGPPRDSTHAAPAGADTSHAHAPGANATTTAPADTTRRKPR